MKIWLTMNRNAHILKHIPGSYDNELAERKCFYDVLIALFPNETEELVKQLIGRENSAKSRTMTRDRAYFTDEAAD